MQRTLYLSVLSLFGCFSIYASSCGELQVMDERLACYDKLAQCASVESDVKRLACFEPTAENLPNKDAYIANPSNVIRTTLPVETIETIETRITSIRMNRSEVLYIYLENGQVWKEITRSRFRYKKGQKVSITRSALGSARLHAEGMKKYAKVSLVKA